MRNKSQFRRISGRGSATLTCPVCTKVFSRPHAHLRGATACCSQACSLQAKPKKPKTVFEFTCLCCGNRFQRRKGYSGPAIYCSARCRAAHAAPKGDKHPRWNGGSSERTHTVRKAIAERLKEIQSCERCGSSEHLHGHHKKPYSSYPELRAESSNIEILCIWCHVKEHPKQAKLLLSRVGILQT